MGGRTGTNNDEKRKGRAMKEYVPIPDYNKPYPLKDDGYQIPDEYPNYWEELEDDHKRDEGFYDDKT